MSPEQVEGKEIDQRSDIYSLGVILYEMVTGQVPFEGDTPFTIGVKHKSEIPKDPNAHNTQVPEELNEVILRCLEKKKEKRYQSAGEVKAELSMIGKGIPEIKRERLKTKSVTSKEITVTFRRPFALVAMFSIVVLAIVLAIVFLKKEKQVPLAQKQKILVVLPFENLGLPEDEYFADGITDELTSRLSALYGLDVISRTSAIQYKNTDKTLKQIKEELDVDYILGGTVRWDKKSGERGQIRVTPQLIRAADETQLWSDTYDRSIEDIFVVQSEIAHEVVKKLDLTILEPERRALDAQPTENLDAYDLFIRANEHYQKGWTRRDPKEYLLAVDLFERAIELDPEFVHAYVTLSSAHSWLYFSGYDRTDDRLSKSKSTVDKALELKPDLPEAQNALAYYFYRGYFDFERALEILNSVLRARPNFRSQLLGYIQRRMGMWEESLSTLERVCRLNPRDSNLAFQQALTYLAMRRYEESKMWLNRVLAIDQDFFVAQLSKASIHIMSGGDTEEALSILEKIAQHPLADYMRFFIYMLDRKFEEASNHLASLPYDFFIEQNMYFQKNLAYAYVYHAQKEFALLRTQADLARITLEKVMKEMPRDARVSAALGLAYAYMGRKDDAIREGNRAMEIHPVSKDALSGPIYILNMAKIYTVVGEYEEAIDRLEYLLSVPSEEYAWEITTVSTLRLDPIWDPLRENSRFQQLLEKYSNNN